MVKRQKDAGSAQVVPGTPEYEANRDLYRQVVEDRVRYRDECIDQLVDAALLYRAEQERSDNALRGRLSQHKQALLDCVKYLNEALSPGPITMREIDMIRKLNS